MFSAVEFSVAWESSVILVFPGFSRESSVMALFTGVPCSSSLAVAGGFSFTIFRGRNCWLYR